MLSILVSYFGLCLTKQAMLSIPSQYNPVSIMNDGTYYNKTSTVNSTCILFHLRMPVSA